LIYLNIFLKTPFFHAKTRAAITITPPNPYNIYFLVLSTGGEVVMKFIGGIGANVGGEVVGAMVVGASVIGFKAEISPSMRRDGATGSGKTTPPLPLPNPGLFWFGAEVVVGSGANVVVMGCSVSGAAVVVMVGVMGACVVAPEPVRDLMMESSH
jgi:hypothetical protein